MTDEHPGYPVSLATGPGAGSRVAGYRLERQIGAGGMAVVYLARDERLGRPVALKVMAQAMAADETFRLRFIRESRAAAAVDDPHIIPVESGEVRRRPVHRDPVRQRRGRGIAAAARGAAAAARVAAIISAVASALDAAHAAGLVHRDVKPGEHAPGLRPAGPITSTSPISESARACSRAPSPARATSWARRTTPHPADHRPVRGRTGRPVCTGLRRI